MTVKKILAYLKQEWSGAWRLPASRAGRWLWVAIFLLGVYLRVGGLDWGLSYTQPIGPPHHDEPHVMHFLKIPWSEYKEQFHEYEIVRPVFLWRVIARPLFTLGEKVGWNSDQNVVFEYATARAVNSVFGVLGLLTVYALGVRLGGVRSGMLAMALLAVMPGHWYDSQLLKGDLLVATYDALLLLCAIRIYDRGSRFWYVLAGLTAGIGAATKPSVVVVLPVVLLAHILRAAREKRLSLLVGGNPVAAVVAAMAAFFALYPYPFIDFARWWKVLTEPTTQVLTVKWLPTIQSFLTSWRDYNEPPRVFLEMIFGGALRRVFPFMALLFTGLVVAAWRAKQAVPYLLTLLASLLVYHSLSFTGPLDDRYAMPLSTFVVLFPAVIAGNFPFAKVWGRRTLATVLALFLFVYTAGVTWVTYPIFAWGKDIRIQVVEFVESALEPGEVVGEFEAGGRQRLPFDRGRTATTRIRTHEDDPHMFLFGQPNYLVVPIEPENYDHAFRYQLYTPTLAEEFLQYVRSFTHLRRFGRQPELLGRKLPRMLSTPVFDVYRYNETPLTLEDTLVGEDGRWRQLPGGRLDPRTSLAFTQPTVLLSEQVISVSEIEGKLLTLTFDLSDFEEQRRQETLKGGAFTVFLLFDGEGAALVRPFDPLETDIAFVQQEGRSGLTIPLKHDELKGQQEFSVSFYFRPGGRIDAYTTQQGHRVGRA
ncbi:MAG: glycosyltransferase family 39 protein, partial [Patescibacteria group bacterium]